MSRCEACTVDIEGAWDRCPLCSGPTTGAATPSPFPTVQLRFSRRRVLMVLFLASLGVIATSFAAQLLFARGGDGIGVLRVIWLGLVTMWLIVVMAIRKRRNVAKGTVYLVVLIDLLCVYWDYLTGWHGWSLTYALPAVGTCSVAALLITVAVMRVDVGDHILYSGATVLLGLAPIVFLSLGWVTNPAPSIVCGAISLATLLLIQRDRSVEIGHELSKRLHL